MEWGEDFLSIHSTGFYKGGEILHPRIGTKENRGWQWLTWSVFLNTTVTFHRFHTVLYSNEVEILCYCTSVVFLDICTLLYYLYFCLLLLLLRYILQRKLILLLRYISPETFVTRYKFKSSLEKKLTMRVMRPTSGTVVEHRLQAGLANRWS